MVSEKLSAPKLEHLKKLGVIRRELAKGSKMWNELLEATKISKPTLIKGLIELQKNGEVERVSRIEGNTQKLEYRLTLRKKGIKLL